MVRRVLPLAAALALALPSAAAAAEPLPTLVVGDSLAVGMRPHLDALLPGRAVTWEARSGRTTPQGLPLLRALVPQVAPETVVVSLGSNDGPDGARFAHRLRRVLAAVPPGACVVWPSIVRPPRKGDEAAINRVLVRAARRDPRLVVVDWQRAVATRRVRLPDGLHPDRAGFRRRARMVAAAVRRGCGPSPGGVAAP